ncbi:hypothetical protein ACLOJK_015107 [Asimina triloba]
MSLCRDYNTRFFKERGTMCERKREKKYPAHTTGGSSYRRLVDPSVVVDVLHYANMGSETVLKLIYERSARGRMCTGIDCGRSQPRPRLTGNCGDSSKGVPSDAFVWITTPSARRGGAGDAYPHHQSPTGSPHIPCWIERSSYLRRCLFGNSFSLIVAQLGGSHA